MRGRVGRNGNSRINKSGGRNRNYESTSRNNNRDFRRGVAMGMGTSRMMRRRRRPFMMMGPRRGRSGGSLFSVIIFLILLAVIYNLLY